MSDYSYVITTGHDVVIHLRVMPYSANNVQMQPAGGAISPRPSLNSFGKSTRGSLPILKVLLLQLPKELFLTTLSIMDKIIFTEEFCQPENLHPFTLTRQIQDIRVGILTIREKWERYLNLPSFDKWEDDYKDIGNSIHIDKNIGDDVFLIDRKSTRLNSS